MIFPEGKAIPLGATDIVEMLPTINEAIQKKDGIVGPDETPMFKGAMKYLITAEQLDDIPVDKPRQTQRVKAIAVKHNLGQLPSDNQWADNNNFRDTQLLNQEKFFEQQQILFEN